MLQCATCGTTNPPQSRFCAECGASLSSTEYRVPSAESVRVVEDAVVSQQPAYSVYPPADQQESPRTVWPPIGQLPPAPVQQRRGVSPWLLIAGLALLVVLVSGAALLLIRPQAQPTQPTSGDVQAILKAADAAQDKLPSLRYTMTASFENLPGSDQPTSMGMRGGIVRPDRYTMSSDRLGDYIVIAGDTYFRQPGSEDWLKVDQTPLGATLVDPNTLGDFASFYKDATLLADEQVAGVDCYHIRLNLSADELSGSGGSPFASGQTVEAEVWVGKGDSLPRKLVLNLSLGQAQPIRTRIETTFADFGADIEIEAPVTANPLN